MNSDLDYIRSLCRGESHDNLSVEYLQLVTPDLVVDLIKQIDELKSLVKSLENEHHHVVSSLEEELNEQVELLKKSEVLNDKL